MSMVYRHYSLNYSYKMRLNVFALLCGIAFVVDVASGKAAIPAKRYQVNLDESPTTR